MNKFLNLFTAILFVSTAILMSCGGGGDDPVEEDPFEIQGTLISSATATATAVSQDNVPATGILTGWEGLTLKFTYDAATKSGTYTTTNSQSDLVWKSSGTWAFGSSTTQITRDDGAALSLSATATAMEISMTITDPNGRLLTFGGNWKCAYSF